MHVYAQLYATKYPINGSMFVNSAMANNRKNIYYSFLFVMKTIYYPTSILEKLILGL